MARDTQQLALLAATALKHGAACAADTTAAESAAHELSLAPGSAPHTDAARGEKSSSKIAASGM